MQQACLLSELPVQARLRGVVARLGRVRAADAAVGDEVLEAVEAVPGERPAAVREREPRLPAKIGVVQGRRLQLSYHRAVLGDVPLDPLAREHARARSRFPHVQLDHVLRGQECDERDTDDCERRRQRGASDSRIECRREPYEPVDREEHEDGEDRERPAVPMQLRHADRDLPVA